MSKQTEKETATAEATSTVTPVDKLVKAREVSSEISKAKTAGELAQVIQDNFGSLGHKVINRMILGQSPEQALRIES